MGFVENFLPPASKDAFAHKVMVQLKKRGVAGPFMYDREEFSLKAGKGLMLYLTNVYEEYSKAKINTRDKVIRRFAEQAAGAGAGMAKLPNDFVMAKGKILPRVRERFFYEAMRLGFLAQGKGAPELPTVKLSEDFLVNLVYDAPESVAMVDGRVLGEWKVEFGEATKIARENLWKMSKENFSEVSPGLFVGPWKDNHAASRLFLHDLIWQLPVKGGSIFAGGHVAMVPNRDTILVAGVEDEGALLAMAAKAEAATREPRFMSGMAVVLKGTNWESFMPAQGSAARDAFVKLRGMTLASWYAEQGKLLGAGNMMQKLRPGNLMMAATAEGKSMTFAIWGEGLESLLPEAEWLSVMGMPDEGAGGGKPKMYGFLRMQDALAAWPELVEKTGDYPVRWRTKGFPRVEQMAGVGMVERPG